VACQWRIRHKLMLGLGLVVAILALLLAGTLKGLSSYRATMKTTESKLLELKAANEIREILAQLKPLLEPNNVGTSEEAVHLETFRKKVEAAKKKLADYRQMLVQTVRLKRDPHNGHNEMTQVQGLETLFQQLALAEQNAQAAVLEVGETRSPILSDAAVKKWVDCLIQASADLHSAINETLEGKIRAASNDCKVSLAIVLSTCIVGILLMAGLLRFFYGWVFYPIRDLQQGAGRIAQGDFEHKIEVHSGDEMQDLAAAFNDMTGRLHEMYADLARQVNERSRQLVRSERLAGVGFLAAGVAHEINNPLASIAFCSEALERRLADVLVNPQIPRKLDPADRETVAKYLKMIQQEAFRCKEITQRLLEFSRGGERRREPADLGELVQGVLDVAQHLQNCKGKKLIFQPAVHIVAPINAQDVKSVVLNLVVNALDSMEEGGTLRITLGQRDRMAELVFTDTGCGMSPEILENIFEPFYTRSRTGKGTGLGLSISHRIISQHGGEIEAVSPGPNQGSTFIVRLPLQPVETAAPAHESGAVETLAFPGRTVGLKEEKRGHAAA
jgi:signal transduction histidine kinase